MNNNSARLNSRNIQMVVYSNTYQKEGTTKWLQGVLYVFIGLLCIWIDFTQKHKDKPINYIF